MAFDRVNQSQASSSSVSFHQHHLFGKRTLQELARGGRRYSHVTNREKALKKTQSNDHNQWPGLKPAASLQSCIIHHWTPDGRGLYTSHL